MAYKINPLLSFERKFAKLSEDTKKRIAEKIDQLASRPETINAPMGGLPLELRGLHKIRVGDLRVFFWVNHEKQEMILYDADRRDKSYKNLYRK